jgi:hypothetical protein
MAGTVQLVDETEAIGVAAAPLRLDEPLENILYLSSFDCRSASEGGESQSAVWRRCAGLSIRSLHRPSRVLPALLSQFLEQSMLG